MLVKNREAILRLTEDVIMREITDSTKARGMLDLVMYCRYRFNWRTVLHSKPALLGVWATLESLSETDTETKVESGVTFEVIVNLVNEWLYRIPDIDGFDMMDLVKHLTKSVLWTASAEALPDSLIQFTGDEAEVIRNLEKNPWVVFLILIGLTDLVRIISDKYTAVPPTPAK